MLDFTTIKKHQKAFPDFKVIPRYPVKYNGVILKRRLLDICFPKINKPEYTEKFNGIILKRRLLDICFPKISKPVGINIFNQFYPGETQHSMILGELLSPTGKHNEGTKFLELFFKNVLDIPFDSNETWIVTAEIERYDVKIRNLDYTTIIILENKSNKAPDGQNQLYRYWYYGIHGIQDKIKTNKKKYGRIFYLSPKYGKEPDDQTKLPPKELLDEGLSISDGIIKTIYFHDEINKWLAVCQNAVEYRSDIYYYLKQYREFWRFYYVV
jgi:hypothetical protein